LNLTEGGQPAALGIATRWRDEILRVLVQNGFVAGRNLEMVERYSEGDADQLPLLAREINASGVDQVRLCAGFWTPATTRRSARASRKS
jgi:hypothetical protein